MCLLHPAVDYPGSGWAVENLQYRYVKSRMLRQVSPPLEGGVRGVRPGGRHHIKPLRNRKRRIVHRDGCDERRVSSVPAPHSTAAVELPPWGLRRRGPAWKPDRALRSRFLTWLRPLPLPAPRRPEHALWHHEQPAPYSS